MQYFARFWIYIYREHSLNNNKQHKFTYEKATFYLCSALLGYRC